MHACKCLSASACAKPALAGSRSLSTCTLFLTLCPSLSFDRSLQHLRCSSLAVWCVLYPSNIENAQKEYTNFVQRYGTGRRKRNKLHKVYILLKNITSRVKGAMNTEVILKAIRTLSTGFILVFQNCAKGILLLGALDYSFRMVLLLFLHLFIRYLSHVSHQVFIARCRCRWRLLSSPFS